jgi:hypothetical protein
MFVAEPTPTETCARRFKLGIVVHGGNVSKPMEESLINDEIKSAVAPNLAWEEVCMPPKFEPSKTKTTPPLVGPLVGVLDILGKS